MEHAWLDSLSEDWVSQPRSDTSQAQLKLPTVTDSKSNSRNTSLRASASRIPRPGQGAASSDSINYDSNANVLGERSSNEINIQGSHRAPSKLSQEIKFPSRGRHFSRSVSASTAGSVLHNTVQHKSLSASPGKTRDQVPEWKRRLLYGDLAYGESKDLFSSAGTGLENIFRPPPEVPDAPEAPMDDNEGYTIGEMTLPSSPPPYMRRQGDGQSEDGTIESLDGELSEIRTAPRVKGVKYARNDETLEESSRPDDSTAERSAHAQDSISMEESEASATSMSAKLRQDASRKVSARSDGQYEDFSPILLSRHNAENGRVSFAPVELPAEQLRKRLDKLRHNQMLLDSDPDLGSGENSAAPDMGQAQESTEDYANNGGFLNFQRGGRSAEGSFRHRPLSPPAPLHTDTSEMLPESSLQASTPKQFPTVRTERFVSGDRQSRPHTPLSPIVPQAPHPSPEKHLQLPRPVGGSPLKLFGVHDTFTNKTLMRRISQFEEEMTSGRTRSKEHSVHVAAQASPSKSEFNDGFVNESSPHRGQQVSQAHHETFGAVNTFGAGELDGHEFSADISISASERSELSDKENVTPEEEATIARPPIKFDVGNQSDASQGDSIRVRRRGQKPATAAGNSNGYVGGHRRRSSEKSVGEHRLHATPKRDGSDGKRPRTSPSKDPTPKRRRTLHRSDIAYGLESRPAEIESVQTSHYHMQSAMGRKRKDARQGDILQPANPSVMALRQVLRPRTPTPSQRSSTQRERHPLEDLDVDAGDADFTAPMDGSDVFVPDFAIDGSRKTSIKTQDFFDEAEKIMAMIRNKARPNTGLASLEESDAESAEQRGSTTPGEMEDSFQDSTKEPFSRPPSRDGRPVSRMPIRQEDPELADRLRKYEEESEFGDLVTYSMRSMGLAKEAIEEVHRINESVQESIRYSEMRHSSPSDGDVVSDLPNVRLSRNPDAPASEENREFSTQGSHSSGGSTATSIPTGSSRGSDSRRLIAPDAVTELIGDQVGNMVLDKERNIWTKVKTPRPVSRSRNILPSEDSEDDPFASIPDLTVDMTREQQNLGLKTAQLEDLEEFVQEDFSPAPSSIKRSAVNEQLMDTKSIMSHTKETFTRITQTLADTTVEHNEEVEHEITIHEDRVQKSSPSRRRNLTITFSSPIASIIQDAIPQHSDGDRTDDEPSMLDRSVGDLAADSVRRGRHAKGGRSVSTMSNKSRSRSRSQGPPRSMSVRGRAFLPRPVSRIDEQDEDTAVNISSVDQRQVSFHGESSILGPQPSGKRATSLSFVITTPAPVRTIPPHVATPVIGEHVGMLSLSPLSEFTMNHGDQSMGLEISYVVGDHYLVTGDGSKKILSQAIRTLVEKITEVEPFEPDWDGMQLLDISNGQLKSLHKLDQFCGGVVTLDASNNSIGHLDGVPESVRNLRINHNHLSELTAWGHLMNLQYVDISDNQISSLYAFKELVHLRSLRADNNQITSLEGIKFHDSLQVLRARGNLIEEIDFDGTSLQRLTELDLQGNQIDSVQNLEQLTCLSSLNLQNNRLTSLAVTAGQSMPALKYLKLSNNALTTLDVAAFPGLSLLHADRNQLVTIAGCARARRLDSLSLREQQGDEPLDVSFLANAYEVRKLFLSGNLLTKFNPAVDFLNLQYLELANCGVQSLSESFGQLMPNLRTLNLNFNAIEDLAPLRYIPRLKKLLVAGNRLADVSAATGILAGFPHLRNLDMRDNPITLGSYPPLQALVPVEQETDFDPFVLPDAGQDRDAKFQSRLDIGTKKRRRVYELVVSKRCAKLQLLDGLAVNRHNISKKDAVWEALVECGAISEVSDAADRDAGC